MSKPIFEDLPFNPAYIVTVSDDGRFTPFVRKDYVFRRSTYRALSGPCKSYKKAWKTIEKYDYG